MTSTNQPTRPAVLLVDDDDVHAEAMQRGLAQAKSPLPLVRAVHGQDALEILRNRHKPSAKLDRQTFIVVLDLNMPIKTGRQFLAELRGDPSLRKAVVFVLTTSDRKEDIEACYEYGVAGFFTKPASGEGYAQLALLITRYAEHSLLPVV